MAVQGIAIQTNFGINQNTIRLKLIRIFVLSQMLGEEVLPDHVVASVDDHAAEQAREAAGPLLDGVALDKVVQPDEIKISVTI